MDLFGEEMTFEDLQDGIESVCNQVTEKYKLPQHGIWYDKTPSTARDQIGLLISYPIFINEPEYPATEEEMEDEKRTHVPILTVKRVLTTKDKDFVAILVPQLFLAQIDLPTGIVVNEKDEVVSEVRVKMASDALMPFLKQVIEWRLKNYVSSASPFGCCDMHVKCSDAKMCLHENRLYSTACAYRRNLEAGRIFYGVNRNV